MTNEKWVAYQHGVSEPIKVGGVIRVLGFGQQAPSVFYRLNTDYQVLRSEDSFAIVSTPAMKETFIGVADKPIEVLVKESPVMKDMKFRVKSEEHSKAIQSWLFEHGYSWFKCGKDFRYTDKQFLFAYTDKSIMQSDDEGHFLTHSNTEVFVEYEVIPAQYKVTKVEEIVPRTIVKVGDKQYYEDELAELVKASANVHPVGE